jgi:hypothetical protein
VDHYADLIREFDQPPVLIGYSYGGLCRRAPAEAASAAYDRYAVPETGQIFYEAGFANFHLHPPTEVHFKSSGLRC